MDSHENKARATSIWKVKKDRNQKNDTSATTPTISETHG